VHDQPEPAELSGPTDRCPRCGWLWANHGPPHRPGSVPTSQLYPLAVLRDVPLSVNDPQPWREVIEDAGRRGAHLRMHPATRAEVGRAFGRQPEPMGPLLSAAMGPLPPMLPLPGSVPVVEDASVPLGTVRIATWTGTDG
jgi:hypothetical protein